MLMIGKQLTAEQRLSKAIVKIMGEPRYTALAGVMMIGDKTVADDVQTAYTNGRDDKFGRAFVEKLTDPELRFLVLHETYHKLYKHLTTWRALWDEDSKLANMACDYVINQKIADDCADGFATMPEGGLLDARFRDMTAAQVFKILRDEGDESEDSDGGGNGDGGMDEHGWEDAKEMTAEESQALERDIDEAIRQGALAAGKIKGASTRDIDALLKPQVDWREVLRDFITSTCSGGDYSTWARPNRRYMGAGVYMPSGISESVDELVLAIDTSGSIGQRTLTTFLSEVKGVVDAVKPSRVRVLYWGSRVVADEVYDLSSMDRLIQSTNPRGGGGTEPQCVPDYMAEHKINPQAVVVLTDGYIAEWGLWEHPLLWCISGPARFKPTIGKYVYIQD
jgi:predicted metal-dependent peptidase